MSRKSFTKKVEGVVEVMLDAIQHCGKPLTSEKVDSLDMQPCWGTHRRALLRIDPVQKPKGLGRDLPIERRHVLLY
jgi:hypothetical protein